MLLVLSSLIYCDVLTCMNLVQCNFEQILLSAAVIVTVSAFVQPSATITPQSGAIVAEGLQLCYIPSPHDIARSTRLTQQQQRDVIRTLWRHCCYDSIAYKCHCNFNSIILFTLSIHYVVCDRCTAILSCRCAAEPQ